MSRSSNISVVLATFNSERFLGQQLESLVRQTRPPDELVVGDDGSTDQTHAILQAFAARAPFPVIVHRNHARLGYTDNFLNAARLCKGELIAFCDHDDVWKEEKLAVCEHAFDNSEVKLVAQDTAEVDAELKLICLFPGIKRSFVINRNEDDPRLPWIAGCAEVVRREVVEEIINRWPADHSQRATRFAGKLLSHDQAAFFIANSLGSIHFIAEPLILHRFHGTNVTSSRHTLGRKLSFSATVGSDGYREQARLFRTQASIMTQMALRGGDPVVTEGLKRKATIFMHVATAARARARIYDEPSKIRRVLMIAEARGRGLYTPRLGMHGFRSVVKDVAAALAPRFVAQR